MFRVFIAVLLLYTALQAAELRVNDKEYLAAQGLSVLVYQNAFHPVFKDQKLSAIEIILHDDRIATDGDVRLMPTPEQWDRSRILKNASTPEMDSLLSANTPSRS